MWDLAGYVIFGTLYVVMLRSFTVGGLFATHFSTFLLSTELMKLLFSTAVYFMTDERDVTISNKQKANNLLLDWKEGVRFVAPAAAYVVFAGGLVLDLSVSRPGFHKVVMSLRPLLVAGIMYFVSDGGRVWGQRTSASALFPNSAMTAVLMLCASLFLLVLPEVGRQTLFEVGSIGVVSLLEGFMYAGASVFHQHLIEQKWVPRTTEARMTEKHATFWQQAFYLFLASFVLMFLLHEAGTPIEREHLIRHFMQKKNRQPAMYAAILGGFSGIFQVMVIRNYGAMGREFGLGAILMCSISLIQYFPSYAEAFAAVGVLHLTACASLLVAGMAIYLRSSRA